MREALSAVPYAQGSSADTPMVLPGGGLLYRTNATPDGTMQLGVYNPTSGETRYVTSSEDFPRGVYGVALAPAVPGTSVKCAVSYDRTGEELRRIVVLGLGPDGQLTERRELPGKEGAMNLLGSWSSDGRSLVYAANLHNNASPEGKAFSIIVCDTDTTDMDTGGRTVCTLPGIHEEPIFTPDGQHVLVRHTVAYNALSYLVACAVNDGGGQAVQLTPRGERTHYAMVGWLGPQLMMLRDGEHGFRSLYTGSFDPRLPGSLAVRRVLPPSSYDVESYTVSPEGNILVARNVEGASEVTEHKRDGVPVRRWPLPSDAMARQLVWPTSGEPYATIQTATTSTGIYRLRPDGQPVPVTRPPGAVPAEQLRRPEHVYYPSRDGQAIPCLLYRPHKSVANGSCVVVVHGGPESQSRPGRYEPLMQYMLAHGFTVLAPNVRGSSGYGSDYLHAADRRKRIVAIEDIGALHAWIASEQRRLDVQPDRTAIMGESYGGYMALCGAAFQPERWAAVVSIAGITDLATFLENTAPYRREMRAQVYGSLTEDRTFLDGISPLHHADAIRAPVLLIHSLADSRVPLSQAVQMQAVLTANGVPCELRTYEKEPHVIGATAKSRAEMYETVLTFLLRVLTPA